MRNQSLMSFAHFPFCVPRDHMSSTHYSTIVTRSSSFNPLHISPKNAELLILQEHKVQSSRQTALTPNYFIQFLQGKMNTRILSLTSRPSIFQAQIQLQ